MRHPRDKPVVQSSGEPHRAPTAVEASQAVGAGAAATKIVSRNAPGVVAFATIASLAADRGGYFPVSWGWASLALLWVAALAVTVRPHVHFGPLEWAFLGGLFALAAWIGLSSFWSRDAPQSVVELERVLVYAACGLAVLLVTRRRSVPQLLAGALAAVTVVCSYSLATRLFPDRIGTFDPVAVYRLSAPVGYWNGLGIFAAMGTLLAAGVAARAKHVVFRAVGAASTVVLVPTLYFTYGRGAILALAIGLAAALVLDPRRLQLLLTLLVVAPAPALAVWLAARSSALTRQSSALDEASAQGHRLAVLILVLAAVAGLLSAMLALAERRIGVSDSIRAAFAGVLLFVAVALLVGVFVRYGGPSTLARKGYDAFNSRPVAVKPGRSFNKRLFSLSSNGRVAIWHVAWRDYRSHPLLGSGAGTYELAWNADRPVAAKVRDAHGLYVETLAELGPVGLVLLLVVLLAPLAAAVSARRRAFVPALAGAYVAFLAHAAADWDWELAAVTATALFCGGGLVVAARRPAAGRLSLGVRTALLVVACAAGGFSVVGLLGNRALAASEGAYDAHRWSRAEAKAHRAIEWAPWSSEAWRSLGWAQLAAGRPHQAARSFRRAIAKSPNDYDLWLSLAFASAGRERAEALRTVKRLNPLLDLRSNFYEATS